MKYLTTSFKKYKVYEQSTASNSSAALKHNVKLEIKMLTVSLCCSLILNQNY